MEVDINGPLRRCRGQDVGHRQLRRPGLTGVCGDVAKILNMVPNRDKRNDHFGQAETAASGTRLQAAWASIVCFLARTDNPFILILHPFALTPSLPDCTSLYGQRGKRTNKSKRACAAVFPGNSLSRH